MGLHCRSLGSAYKGSNPPPTTPGVTALTRGNAGGARSRVSGRVRLCPVAPGGAWRNRPFDEVRDERRSAWPAVPADRSRRAARYCWAAGRTDDRRGRDPALTCGRQVPSPLITHVRMDPDPAGARRAAHHYRRHHRGVLPITAPLLAGRPRGATRRSGQDTGAGEPSGTRPTMPATPGPRSGSTLHASVRSRSQRSVLPAGDRRYPAGPMFALTSIPYYHLVPGGPSGWAQPHLPGS